MQIHVKTLLLTIFFLVSGIVQADQCETLLSNNDINHIVQSLNEKEDIFKDNGFFFDPREETVIKKQDIYNKIKAQGAVYLFPNITSYKLFLRYLKKINSNQCAFIGKDIEYKVANKTYVFTLVNQEDKIVINILIRGSYIEDFGYPETVYMYSFEKNANGTIELSEINSAG